VLLPNRKQAECWVSGLESAYVERRGLKKFYAGNLEVEGGAGQTAIAPTSGPIEKLAQK